MDLTKFKITDTQYLKINPENIDKDECKFCANVDIDYVDETNNICIRFGYEHFSSLCYFVAESGYIQELINEKKSLDESIMYDLGFEWNQFFQGVQKSNICFKYHCFSNDHKGIRPYYNSWMYNDENGNVVFEITPFYPWHGKTKKSNPDFITYKQFMKDYKPTLITTIPKENLKQWIDQAKKLKKKYYPELEKT